MSTKPLTTRRTNFGSVKGSFWVLSRFWQLKKVIPERFNPVSRTTEKNSQFPRHRPAALYVDDQGVTVQYYYWCARFGGKE